MNKITKNEIVWGYLSQIFSLLSGLITLPIILKFLTPEEIGMNYLILSLGTIVSLFDFGFTPQFSRSVTYVFSGVQELKKEGISDKTGEGINYRLLSTLISTAKDVYKRIAFIALFVLLTLGTYYIYYVTKGFSNVNNSLIIWILYSLSVFLNIYYFYYGALLGGKGLIIASRKAMVYSKLVYIIITFVLLFLDLGLISVVIGNLIAPFISRYISYKSFFTNELLKTLNGFYISREEKLELFKIVWHNSKKLGLVFIGSFAVNKLNIFLAGLFLPLSEIGSLGLMNQIFSIISTASGMYFWTSMTHFSSLRSKSDEKTLIKDFAMSMNIFYILFILGAIFVILLCPYLLNEIHSKLKLPNNYIILIFAIVLLLEGNHSCFATMIVTKNNIPFVTPALVAGFFICLGEFFVLKYTDYGILGLIIIQGFVQLCYANWKWPFEVCKEFKINFWGFCSLGMQETLAQINFQLSKKKNIEF